MRVLKTDCNCNLNFKEIYKDKSKMTDVQTSIANDIAEKLRIPREQFGNTTAEDYYKKKYGYDFCIENYGSSNNSVYLEAIIGTKHTGTGIDECITYKNSVSIGAYNSESSFDINDIETGLNEKCKKNTGFLLPAIFVILALGTVIGCAIANIKPKNIKSAVENADSLINMKNSNSSKTINLLQILKN